MQISSHEQFHKYFEKGIASGNKKIPKHPEARFITGRVRVWVTQFIV